MLARQSSKSQVALVLILLGLALSGSVTAQTPTPAPTSTPTPEPTFTPLAVLIVTPAVMATPASPWSEPVQKLCAQARMLWAAFGWWAIPFVALLVLALFGWRYIPKAVDKAVELRTEHAVQKWQQERERTAALDKATRDYLEAAIWRKFRLLDLKPLDPEMYRAEVRLQEVYIPLRAKGGSAAQRAVGQEQEEVQIKEREMAPALTEHLARFSPLVILGRAGSGKSTFVQYPATILADALLHGWPGRVPEELDTLKAAFDPPPLPIYLPLRDFVPFWEKTLKPEEKTLACQGEALLRFLKECFGAAMGWTASSSASAWRRDSASSFSMVWMKSRRSCAPRW
jgi:hypothetical protein